ncbi:MAG: hypothetical protein AAGA56_31095, partial [Myxococcota bacterium]
MNRRRLSRRTMLRGLGSVAIALPLLEEMIPPEALAQGGAAPIRAFNLFFGLGMPTPLQTEGFAGPLEPYRELEGKIAVVRGVNQVNVDRSGQNAHFDGSAG